MHLKFKQLLRQYKLEVFHAAHDKKSAEEIATECLKATEDVLKHKFHYHFHSLPDANRAEVVNMINNYVREAILPPVVERMVHRQIMLERKLDALLHLQEQILETLSEGSAAGAP